jgi:hypothetical protein
MDFFFFLPGLALNCDPPDLCLPSSWIIGGSHHVWSLAGLKIDLLGIFSIDILLLLNKGSFIITIQTLSILSSFLLYALGLALP